MRPSSEVGRNLDVPAPKPRGGSGKMATQEVGRSAGELAASQGGEGENQDEYCRTDKERETVSLFLTCFRSA